MISCRSLHYTYGGMYHDSLDCVQSWGPPPGIDRGKLGSTRPIRHCHVRWCGVLHYCSVDRAACPHFTDRRVKWVFSCGSIWSNPPEIDAFVPRKECFYGFFTLDRKAPC